jgi:putative colanic acid biosysnthesis UDP-glucose lipid carrier transferase
MQRRSSKRLFDLVGAVLLLLFLAPLLFVISLAIASCSGRPVLSRLRRIGQFGHPFILFAFRSSAALKCAADGAQALIGGNPVTLVGRLLRISGLCDLPQLINVLCGNMSLVGPRPFSEEDDEYYAARIGNYSIRYQVKPGIFGWAEVNGVRSGPQTVDLMRKRARFDAWYVTNASVGLDLRILARTFLRVLRG